MTTIGAHPAQVDLTVHAGEPVDFTVPVLNSDGTAVSGLSGWTATAQARATADGPLLHTFAAAVDGATVRVTAAAAETSGWTFTRAQWDLLLTAPDSTPHVLCGGWIRVYPTITH